MNTATINQHVTYLVEVKNRVGCLAYQVWSMSVELLMSLTIQMPLPFRLLVAVLGIRAVRTKSLHSYAKY